jgi:hypothetical protein
VLFAKPQALNDQTHRQDAQEIWRDAAENDMIM